MNLQLTKDIVFFDLEATGLNVLRDRIIQLAMIKFSPGSADPVEREYLINPGMPISEEAMQVHGITPADVVNKPTFCQVADEIRVFFGDADLAGYRSNQYDIPMLIEEFGRCGIEFSLDNRRMVDVQRIFYKMEPRTLKAAYKFYVGGEMDNAHDAMSDVRATVAVLDGQLNIYKGQNYEGGDGEVVNEPVKPDVGALHDFTNDMRMVDATQRLRYDHNRQVVFNFGKYNGQPVAETLSRDKQYYNWILNKEFSIQVKTVVKQLVTEYEKTRKNS